MSPAAQSLKQYHIFLMSPNDVQVERHAVRKFIDNFNRTLANHMWGVNFEVVDWENYASVGLGDPQQLITHQTLDRFKESLVLVIGIMGQRFGSPTANSESGTQEEFDIALAFNKEQGFPEIKFFFRAADKMVMPTDMNELQEAVEQWKKVCDFREGLEGGDDRAFYQTYPGPDGFAEVLRNDLNLWLAHPDRPWVKESAGRVVAPSDFNSEPYREALLKRFNNLNFEIMDTTGAYYHGVSLWNVFVPQSVRECHEYVPQILEIPKEHQQRLIESGELDPEELAEAEKHSDERRRDYFNQPLRPVLDVVTGASSSSAAPGSHSHNRTVILGDPGSGKSSLMRYLALRWSQIEDAELRDSQPLPLLVELGQYNRWQCDGRKDFVRYLAEGLPWHAWDADTLASLLSEGNPKRQRGTDEEDPSLTGRVTKPIVLLLDGLDEIFDPAEREEVVDQIHAFAGEHPHVQIVVTSRVVGYKPQRLRDAEFRHFMLQDLDADQIEAFLAHWHEVTFENADEGEQKRERLASAIKQSKSIGLLAGNPLLLTMMAILNRNQKLPDDRVDLYQQCSRLLLHQWDVEEKLLEEFPGLSDEIGLREKTDILRAVAYAMQTRMSDKSRANYIDGTTLTSLIEDYLHTELRFDQARAVARALVEQLRARNFILCYLGADSYAFVHRTFLEYFCAADIVHQFNVAKTLSEQDLIALFDAHCRHDDWREVLRLICGQIDEQFVGRIVEHLATRTDLQEWDGQTPLPELPLAIYCLSELRSAGHIQDAGRTLLECIIGLTTKKDGKPREFFLSDLVPPCRELGTRWPGRERLEQVALSQFEQMTDNYGDEFWPFFVAHVAGSWKATAAIAVLTRPRGFIIRRAAVQALSEKWSNEATRKLLTERAVQDDDEEPRFHALQALAEKWPDENTRELLAQRAVQDDDEYPRRAALQALAEKWPDETTRELLEQRAVQDDHGSPRNAALQALAEKWPDETTRELLAQRAVQDDNEYPRRAALQALAEKWPDETTLELLEAQVGSFKDDWTRSKIEKSIESLRAKLSS